VATTGHRKPNSGGKLWQKCHTEHLSDCALFACDPHIVYLSGNAETMQMLTRPCTLLLFGVFLILTGGASSLPFQHKDRNGASSPLLSGEIHGRITISLPAEPDRGGLPDPLLMRYGTGHVAHALDSSGERVHNLPTKLSEKTVVYLENQEINSRRYVVPDNHPVLDQRGLQFHPRVLPILIGTTVDFPNRDNLFHNVFSYSRTKPFDLGRYPTGESRSVEFGRPGVVRVYCDIHSDMRAVILVLQNPYFTAPDEKGRYSLKDIPPGSYTLVVWFDRDVLERQRVELQPGQSLEINVSH